MINLLKLALIVTGMVSANADLANESLTNRVAQNTLEHGDFTKWSSLYYSEAFEQCVLNDRDTQLTPEPLDQADLDGEVEQGSASACKMDAVTTSNAIINFFRDLRGNGLLFSKKEFDRLDKDNYISKGGEINRLQGKLFIERVVKENQLVHIKIPKKILVVDREGGDILPVVLNRWGTLQSSYLNPNMNYFGKEWTDSWYFHDNHHIKLYAEKIMDRGSDMTPEEQEELEMILRKTEYQDYHPGQIVLATDGVYIIDTDLYSVGAVDPITQDKCLLPGHYKFEASQIIPDID